MTSSAPPEGRTKDRTGRLLLVLGFGCFAGTLAGRTLDPLVGVLSGEFQVPVATVALLSTAFALPYALVQPVLGPIGDAVGKVRVVLWALAALALALLACALAQGLSFLFLARILSGAAAGGIFPLCIAIIGDRVPLERRQVALSRLLVWSLTGQVLGGALSGFLQPVIGWRGVMVACALVAALAALVLRAGARAGAEPVTRPSLPEAARRYAALLRLPAARVLYLAVFIEAALVFGTFPFFVPLLEGRGIGSTAEAGLSVAAFGLGGFLFAGLAPWLVRNLGQARMIQAGGAACSLALLALAVAPAAHAFAAAVLVLGLGFYMIHNSIQTRVTEVAPGARGSAVALHACCFFLGQSAGPVLFGLGKASLSPGPTLALAAAGMAALGLWLGRRR
jgi:predicted MFS family arabinose efflux permease